MRAVIGTLERRPHYGWSSVVVGQAAFVTAVTALWLISWALGFRLPGGVWLTCALFTVHSCWAGCSWRFLTGSWVDAYSLFFLSLCAFNGGQLWLEFLDLLPNGILDHAYGEDELLAAVLLVTAAAVAFHAAGVAVWTWDRHAGTGPATAAGPGVASARRFRNIALFFVAVSLPFTLQRIIESVEIAATAGYMALYEQTFKMGFENWKNVLATFFFPGTLFLLASFRSSRRWVVVTAGMAFVYVSTNLFLGARGPASAAAVSFLLLYHNSVRRIPPWVVWSTVACALLAFPVIRLTRTMSGEERSQAYREVLSCDAFHLTDTIEEMGGSFVTVVTTIDLVPSSREFDWGAGYLRAAGRAIPNVTGSIRETYADWYMRATDPVGYDLGGGMGFSVIAEGYANFSWFGPPAVLAAAGALLSLFVRRMRRTARPMDLALEATVVWAILVIPRAETAVCLRPLVWFCLVPYLLAATKYRTAGNCRGVLHGRDHNTTEGRVRPGCVPILREQAS